MKCYDGVFLCSLYKDVIYGVQLGEKWRSWIGVIKCITFVDILL